MGKWSNALGNTAGLAPRTAGTALYGALDTVKAAGNVFSDFGDVVQNTSSQLKEVLSSSRNTGKWYNKLYQVPAGIVIGAGTVVEGAVRAVLEPTRNAILNVRDVLGNFFKNIGNTIGRTFDSTRPVSDFRYEHLKTKKTTGKNWFSSFAWWKKSANASASASLSSSASNASASAPASSPVSASSSPSTHLSQQSFNAFQTSLNNQHQAMMTAIANLTTAVQQLQQQNAQSQNQPSNASNQTGQWPTLVASP